MRSIKILQLLNVSGFLFMMTMNVLANALPLFGRDTGEISALFPNLFVPAGFTFSIWGIIYLLLLVFTIAQLRGFFGKNNTAPAYVGAMGPWYFISGLANGLWIVVWHALQPLLSLAVMLLLLWSLIRIYQALSQENKFTVRLPISVYLGWISVATIANATAVLVHYHWSGFGLRPEVWTVIMIAVAVGAGRAFLREYADIPYALVIIWALYGIFSRTAPEQQGIYYTLIAGMILLGVFSVARLSAFFRIAR